VYDSYVDPSRLALTINNVTSVPGAIAGEFDVTVEFSITKNGQPFVDTNGLLSMDQKRFYAVQYDSSTRQYRTGETNAAGGGVAAALLNDADRDGVADNIVPDVNAGDYVLTQTGVPFAPEGPFTLPFDGAQVYGYIAQTPLFEHESASSELPEGTHVHLYDDVANAALAFGTAAAVDPNSYESLANVSGCENCHGVPYLKHGYRAPEVAGLPDFASCKSCHNDDRNGGHEDWQYMVDDPANWATFGLPTATVEAKYAYKAKLMNDVHMAHAMEFPYPRSMANCATCHNGLTEGGLSKLDLVLDNSNFTPESCKSCHPVEGLDAWPADAGPVLEGAYAQDERAPPLMYLWTKIGVEAVHDINADCQVCHGVLPNAPAFNQLHTGYDVRMYNAAGVKYRDLFTASIDNISVDLLNNELTIAYSADESAIVNAVPGSLDVHVYVSFYGWDSKHFIVPSHTRDTNRNRYEFSGAVAVPPLFPSLVELAPGSWELTVDMAAWIDGDGGFIPDLIADGTIKNVLITLAPRLEVDIGRTYRDSTGTVIDANLNAVTRTADLGAAAFVDNYFAGTNATVDETLCEKCHDQLAVTWHSGRGRGGDIMACKNCHNPTYAGSHVEMASRSVENYVHAIHTFQDFDVDDVFHDDAEPDDPAHGEDFDPVLAKRYDQHIQHVFPNFTARNCEACHKPGTYNVPDQTKSIPGLLSAAQTVDNWYEMVDPDPTTNTNIPSTIAILKDERNIGTVPEYVVGPASRACGGCHRARLINRDLAGDLAAFNAHTEAGGTLVENDENEWECADGTVITSSREPNCPDGSTPTLISPADEILFGIIDKIMKLFE
ncbi:MAG: multiheme c-type cytochrome, partial [Planctomycetota bacterium]